MGAANGRRILVAMALHHATPGHVADVGAPREKPAGARTAARFKSNDLSAAQLTVAVKNPGPRIGVA